MHPMQTLFRSPEASNCRGNGLHQGGTEQKGACFWMDLLAYAALRSNYSQIMQVFHLCSGSRCSRRSRSRIVRDDSDARSSMRFLNLAIRLVAHVSTRLVSRQGERRPGFIAPISPVLQSRVK